MLFIPDPQGLDSDLVRPLHCQLESAVGTGQHQHDGQPPATQRQQGRQQALHLPEPIQLDCVHERPERLVAELAIYSLDLVLADTPAPPAVKVRAYSHLLGECGVSVFGIEGGGQSWLADSCAKSVICAAETLELQAPEWRIIMTSEFSAESRLDMAAANSPAKINPRSPAGISWNTKIAKIRLSSAME